MSTNPFNPSVFLGDDRLVTKIQRKYAGMFRPGEVVLDLGCGDGVFLRLLKERGIRGIGVDSLLPCVETCRRSGLEAHQSDILAFLQEATGSYDGIFCSHIVEHLPPQVVLDLLTHARRVLKPTGRIVIVTPNARDIEVITERFWLDITHVRPYPIPLLEKMLEHAGFAVTSSGIDPDSSTRLLSKSPLKMWKKLVKKIRWGEYWGKGDSFVVAVVR